MGRLLGALSLAVVLAAGACAGKRAERAAVVDAGAPPRPVAVAVVPAPAPSRPAIAPDAPPEPADEPQAPAIKPGDVLQGAAAEQAIGESPPPPSEPSDPAEPALLISPLGVGPFALGLPRQAVKRRLPQGAELVRGRSDGEATFEHADFFDGGVHLLHLVLYGGRLVEVTVLARDRRALTTAEIGVGSTFDDAELAHGDPRKVGRGWVLSALPGVVFAPADATLLAVDKPPAEAKIGRVIVVGPEAD